MCINTQGKADLPCFGASCPDLGGFEPISEEPIRIGCLVDSILMIQFGGCLNVCLGGWVGPSQVRWMLAWQMHKGWLSVSVCHTLLWQCHSMACLPLCYGMACHVKPSAADALNSFAFWHLWFTCFLRLVLLMCTNHRQYHLWFLVPC